MEMVGDKVGIELDKTLIYRTRILRSEHVRGDPLFDCAVYTQDNSYEDCIRKDLRETYEKKVGCQPPHFADDLNNVCNQKLNVSSNKTSEIVGMFNYLFWKSWRSNCKTPCTKSKYMTSLSSKTADGSTGLFIVFDQTSDVARSRFSINGLALYSKLGGLIGAGRTLLWILVSLLGAVQVTLSDTFKIFTVVMNL